MTNSDELEATPEPTFHEVTIERMAPGGYGIAHGAGKTFLVRGGIAGERVVGVVTGVRGRALELEVSEVITASPDRVLAPDAGALVDGGNDLAYMTYEAQLRTKEEMVRDAFFRIGRLELTEAFTMIPSPSVTGWRTRATWHLDPMTGDFGYYARGTRTVIDTEHSPMLEPLLDAELRKTREDIRAGLTAGLSYQAAAGDTTADAWPGVGEPEPLYRKVRGFNLRYDAPTFFQANGLLLETMIDEALWMVKEAGPSTEAKTALDLYAGVGFFSLPLSDYFGQVLAVEFDERAVNHGKRNISSSHRRNVTMNKISTDRFFQDQQKAARRAAFVLVDPPRTGLETMTRTGIIEAGIPEITYVSCDATTLARDLKEFVAAGYVVQRVHGIDMFPQSHHVEVISHLRKG
jgi:tRNA/tmRNA/rRNA uracil-C5-methylase (TrmA/RlmC/RlmD family)